MTTSKDDASYRERLAVENLTPLWDVMRDLVSKEPPAVAEPVHWRGATWRKHVLDSGDIISAEKAERRVLVLVNPALRESSRVATSLYAGVQLILPGEIAAPHRHTAAAIRFILEGTAYTSVDGARIDMRRGDFIITPSWTFHDHGNDSTAPAMWLDGLDVPVVNLLNAGFLEDGAGANDFAVSGVPTRVTYPYAPVRAALDVMRRETPDSGHGYKLSYRDEASASPTRTMGAYLQLMPRGFVGRSHRSTENAVFVVVEGRGHARVTDKDWAIGEDDIFVVPSWQMAAFSAEEDLVLFSFSDRPLQEHLGYYREA